MLPKIIVGVVLLLIAFFAVGSFFRDKRPDFTYGPNQQERQEQPEAQQTTPDLGAGVNKPFYSQDGLYLTHSWPGENNFSNEETEILLFNESDFNVEVKSFDLTYSVEGKTYPHKSGTWEKFPAKDNHERIEYLNISPQYYKGEQLLLTPGQKGKLHWHINFGSQPLDGKQTVKVKLTLIKNGQTLNIDEEFNRNSGQVFSKDEH